MLYSSATEGIFIPSRCLVAETSARSVLIGHNFTGCCFWKTLNSTHKGTPMQPTLESDSGQMEYFGMAAGHRFLPLLPATIHIKEDGAFLPSQSSAALLPCLHADSCFCALTRPSFRLHTGCGTVKALIAIYRQAWAATVVLGGLRLGATWKKAHITIVQSENVKY